MRIKMLVLLSLSLLVFTSGGCCFGYWNDLDPDPNDPWYHASNSSRYDSRYIASKPGSYEPVYRGVKYEPAYDYEDYKNLAKSRNGIDYWRGAPLYVPSSSSSDRPSSYRRDDRDDKPYKFKDSDRYDRDYRPSKSDRHDPRPEPRPDPKPEPKPDPKPEPRPEPQERKSQPEGPRIFDPNNPAPRPSYNRG